MAENFKRVFSNVVSVTNHKRSFVGEIEVKEEFGAIRSYCQCRNKNVTLTDLTSDRNDITQNAQR